MALTDRQRHRSYQLRSTRTSLLFSCCNAIFFILLLHTMSPQLCATCSSSCAKPTDFWSLDFDRLEYCQTTFTKLQSYRRMREEAKNGCQLCSVLLNYPQPIKVEDEEATLVLRRCSAFPDRAVILGEGAQGRGFMTQTFFRRVPGWWWSQSDP